MEGLRQIRWIAAAPIYIEIVTDRYYLLVSTHKLWEWLWLGRIKGRTNSCVFAAEPALSFVDGTGVASRSIPEGCLCCADGWSGGAVYFLQKA
jgi:hypothetical protein